MAKLKQSTVVTGTLKPKSLMPTCGTPSKFIVLCNTASDGAVLDGVVEYLNDPTKADVSMDDAVVPLFGTNDNICVF